MSDITIISTCEYIEGEKLCKKIEEKIGKSLYDVIEDDWRRPIVDGILVSLISYSDVDKNKIKKILYTLRYYELVPAIEDLNLDDLF